MPQDVHRGEQSVVAPQLVTEDAECAQRLLGLKEKSGVVLIVVDAHGIFDMSDADFTRLECLAEEHILITIVRDTLIEGMTLHHLATHHKIGGSETLIWP